MCHNTLAQLRIQIGIYIIFEGITYGLWPQM